MDNVAGIVIAVIVAIVITVMVTVGVMSHKSHSHSVRHVVTRQVEAPIHQFTVHKHSDTPVVSSGGVSTNDWLLYYYIFTANNQTYYYSSPTPVSNFSSIRFSEVSGSTSAALPDTVRADITGAQEQDIQPEPAAEPTVQEVEVEVVGDTENAETYHDGTDANGNTVDEAPSAPSESAPADSGSTGGDAGASSGGGDAGGGGDGGGGGGGE